MTHPQPRLPLAGRLPLAQPKLSLVPAPALENPVSVDAKSSGLVWARQFRTKLLMSDVGIVMTAVATALLVRFGGEGAQASVGGYQADYWLVALLIALSWIATLGAFHTRNSRVIGIGATEYKQVINASALTFGLLAIGFLAFQVDVARGFFVLALPVGMCGLVLERWLWRRWLLRQRAFGHYLARVIVVGNRADVEYVVGQIENAGATYYVVGIALANGSKSPVKVQNRTIPVVSDLAHVGAAATNFAIDTVIVAGAPSGGSEYIRTLGWELEGTSAELVLSNQLTDVAGPRIHFRPVEGLPLIHVEIPQFEGAKHVLKRILDIGLSGISLLVFWPLLVAIAIVVKLDSPGPILFHQERCGRNERTFQMVKFRSMVQTAEDDLAGLLDQNEASGVLFKIQNDPRITRCGRLLRKYSLDELPQLWNIFVGEMSLVGPRPPLPEEVKSYDTHVRRRLYIKPGLTGMWQINGRSNLSWEDSVRLDLYYVENWSLTGDLYIIWRTFRMVMRAEGAY
ncbi:sugar transferase [Cryobacterium sp. TMT3-29-2]|nr:sugar transferase [Cryobacterium sp. TMT3-29-2]